MVNEENNNELNERPKLNLSKDKLKSYGKEAYVPLLNLVHKYQDEFTPYLESLAKGLKSGGETLSQEGSSEVERYVSQFFNDAARGIDEACKKLQAKDFSELSNYISDLAEKKPSIMFSVSYVSGVFFGRLGKHIIQNKKADQSFH